MGIELTNDRGGIFELRHLTWALLLNLAERYDWKPKGTSLADSPGWNGAYDENSGQVIEGDDAKLLATALRRAFDAADLKQQDAALALAFTQSGLHVLPGWSHQLRSSVSELIEFLSGGAVQIQ